MKKLIWFAFVIDLLMLVGIILLSGSEPEIGAVELHVTMLRLVVEASALAVLKEMRQ